MNIVINEIIIHVLDNQICSPVLSKSSINLSEDIQEYIIFMLNKALTSDDYKLCSFKGTSKCLSLVKYQNENLVEISKHVANSIFSIMLRNTSIPSCDLVVARIVANSIQYLAILKLNYRKGFIHHYQNDQVNIIMQRTVLPTEKSIIDEAIFIDLESYNVKIIEKKFEIDGVKDYYLSTLVLDCIQTVSEKGKLKIVQKIAEDIFKESSISKNSASEVASIIIDETNDENKLYVRQICNKLDKLYPDVKPAFEQSILSNGMDLETEINISRTTINKMSKQALHTESGVEIRIPMNSKDDVEYINNPDGTISILIKNVKFR